MLLTETFSYHDRRNEDLASDDGDNATTDDPGGNPDDDWDSRLLPQSGAFFELYHPWNQANGFSESLPAELDVAGFTADGAAGGVDLGQLTPTSSDPVWRIALKRNKTDVDGAGNDQFLRAIYFATVTPGAAVSSGLATGSDYFFTTLASKTVEPGEYAVVGSSGNVGLTGGSYETTFGRLSSSSDPIAVQADVAVTRSIGLNHADDMVIRRDGLGGGSTDEAKVIVIDSSSSVPDRSLSLSEPLSLIHI